MPEGLPDHHILLWRAPVYHRIVLKDTEALLHLVLMPDAEASPYPYRTDAISGGSSEYAIDATTGTTTQTVPAGYTWGIYYYWWAFNAIVKGMEYLDNYLFASLFNASHVSHYEHDIGEDRYAGDPTGASAHTRRWLFKNLSGHDCEGFFHEIIKITEVGTERFQTKTVRCRNCKEERVVERQATMVKCPVCDEVTIYFPVLFGKEKPITELIL